MSLHKQLKTAADQLEKLAVENGSLSTQVGELTKKLAAASQQTKTAGTVVEANKAKLAGLAKTAAEKLRTAGMLSTPEMGDAFAAQILDHSTALSKLAALAEQIKPVKTATVMVDPVVAEPTSDAVWDRSIQSHSGRTR